MERRRIGAPFGTMLSISVCLLCTVSVLEALMVPPCISDSQMRCNSGECIPDMAWCDGVTDCADSSDENNCVHDDSCKQDEFKCANGSPKCIPMDWVCDDAKDCADNSDEISGCGNFSLCRSFQCKTGQCLSWELRCDGEPDCRDGSDEEDCKGVQEADCQFQSKMFRCADGSRCIPLARMCDTHPNCDDGSDEGDACKVPCAGFKSCSQSCSSSPKGPMCYCGDGWDLAPDGISCDDHDECMSWGTCSQMCINTPGNFTCKCAPGFLIQTDGKSCRAEEPEAEILIAAKSAIRSVGLRTRRERVVRDNLHQAVAVAYELHGPQGPRIYWANVAENHRSVWRATLTPQNVSSTVVTTSDDAEKLLSDGLSITEAIAVDWVASNLYLNDAKTKLIVACGLKLMECTVLHRDDLSPRALALAPTRAFLFWTAWGKEKAKVMRSGMDGSNPTALVWDNIKWPNGLAVDEPAQKLYVADAHLDHLEAMNFDGLGRHSVLSKGLVSHPFGLVVFEEELVWSEWHDQEVKSCDKRTGHRHRDLLKQPGLQPFGLAVAHPAAQAMLPNPCSNAECKSLCLLSPVKDSPNAKCACPIGRKLSRDMKSCEDTSNSDFIIAGDETSLKVVHIPALGTSAIRTLNTTFGRIGAVAYDAVGSSIVVSDVKNHTIVAVSLWDGTTQVLVPAGHVGYVEALDVDTTGRLLYFADSERQTIEVIQLEPVRGKRSRATLARTTTRPVSLALAPNLGLLFFGCSGRRSSSIERMQMNGEGRRPIVRASVREPVGMAFDHVAQTLYWVDAITGMMEKVSVDGLKRRPVRLRVSQPVSLAIMDNSVYWSERRNSGLVRSLSVSDPGRDGPSIELSSAKETYWMRLASAWRNVRPEAVPPKEHPCSNDNGGCSHLCLMHAGGSTCTCPDGVNMTSDKTTCGSPPDCNSTHFQCADGMCILSNLQCDGKADCFGSEDESGCLSEVTCSFEWSFKCADGVSCIPTRWKCDGEPDCVDGSDELNCTTSSSECSQNRFRCRSNGRCIVMKWRCDGEEDCADGSDEENCDVLQPSTTTITPKPSLCPPGYSRCSEFSSQCVPNSAKCNGSVECIDGQDEAQCVCGSETFSCRNQMRCVPLDWVCDGQDDCGDNSDETDIRCLITVKPTHNTTRNSGGCRDGEWSCLSGGCMSLGAVCDNHADCLDESDEGGRCNDACITPPNGGCEGRCRPTPTGPACICNPGFRLRHDRFCSDIDECRLHPSPCSQFCNNTWGGFKCSCAPEYQLGPDELSCMALGPEATVVYTNNNQIWGIHISTGHSWMMPMPSTSSVGGLDFRADTGDIWWSDSESGEVHRAAMRSQGSGQSYRLLEGLKQPGAIAVDWITSNLYYVSRDPVGDSIAACSTVGLVGDCVTITTRQGRSVSSLALVPEDGHMVWSEIAKNPLEGGSIWAADMDGKNTRILASHKVTSPVAVSVDHPLRRVAWADAGANLVESIGLDGHQRRRLFSTHVSRPTGLVLFEGRAVWLNGDAGSLASCKPTPEGEECRVLASNLVGSGAMTIVQPSRQPWGANGCTRKHCEHMCLLKANAAVCMCPNGTAPLVGQTDKCASITFNNSSKSPDKSRTAPGGNSELSTAPSGSLDLPSGQKHPEVSPVEESGSSVTTGVVVVIVLLIIILIGAACLAYRKRIFAKARQFSPQWVRFNNDAEEAPVLPFSNPTYDDTPPAPLQKAKPAEKNSNAAGNKLPSKEMDNMFENDFLSDGSPASSGSQQARLIPF